MLIRWDSVVPYAGVSYGLARFPFALCSVVLFCCPSLGANLEPGADYPNTLAEEFFGRLLKNRFPRPLLMLGDGSASNGPQWNDLLTRAEAGNLHCTIGTWTNCSMASSFIGPIPHSLERPGRSCPVALSNLRAQLSTIRNMSLGVAVGQNVASGPHVAALASALGAASVYLLPAGTRGHRLLWPHLQVSKQVRFSQLVSRRTLLKSAEPISHQWGGSTASRTHAGRAGYYDESTLELLWRHVGMFLGQDAQSSVCYLLPADVLSFRVAQRTRTRRTRCYPARTVAGFGPAGRATGCARSHGVLRGVPTGPGGLSTSSTSSTASLHLGDGVWLSYTAPQQMKHFADALRDNLTAGCLGLWNPQWDDFAAACGGLEYPLARALLPH
ncbi:hypothetical protein HPB51_012652 [Rhipicephalus microplus]|uniref:Uncharacterized protein n=1 Tax=Rhipicephalus microplus TaxID=6941 RepID=A0A9J6E1E9_RHIMP|nr:hypothetical protein HPB51_012652 [Rhipicephalus microplus]